MPLRVAASIHACFLILRYCLWISSLVTFLAVLKVNHLGNGLFPFDDFSPFISRVKTTTFCITSSSFLLRLVGVSISKCLCIFIKGKNFCSTTNLHRKMWSCLSSGRSNLRLSQALRYPVQLISMTEITSQVAANDTSVSRCHITLKWLAKCDSLLDDDATQCSSERSNVFR